MDYFYHFHLAKIVDLCFDMGEDDFLEIQKNRQIRNPSYKWSKNYEIINENHLIFATRNEH
ncbi:MAG: hypothetical protein RL582_1096 [Bacteroidota bacterium]